MRYSEMFGKTSKTAPADAESVNAKFLTQGGFISQQMAGVYNYLPLGLRVLNKIQNIVRDEMNLIGGNEILMSALNLEENYAKTGRNEVDIMFHLEGQDKSAYVLNWSHEEVVTPLVKGHTFSYRDLPVAVYQIQNKFRNEPRAKSGLLRGREFCMKDLYSFHANSADLDSYYDKVTDAYFKIYRRLGLGDITVLAYASGGAFSRYSHEFQAISTAGEDTIYLCQKCKTTAVNKEIIDEMTTCPNPECLGVDLTETKAIEVGNIFKLQTRYSDAFNFKYKDKSDAEQQVLMGCYGIGISRLMGTIVEIFHDDKGIIWPESVAPYRVHLVALGPDEANFKEAEKVYQELLKNKVEVLYDDRVGSSAGEKFSDADLIGLPLRAIISKKSLAAGGMEIKERNVVSGRVVTQAEFLAMFSK